MGGDGISMLACLVWGIRRVGREQGWGDKNSLGAVHKAGRKRSSGVQVGGGRLYRYDTGGHMGSLPLSGRAISKFTSLLEGETLLHNGTYDSKAFLYCSA